MTDQLDPHVWLDPTNMITITDAVRDKLAAVDPGHAADYTERAAALNQDLTRLDQSFAAGLKSCQREDSSPPTPPSATWPVATS